MANLSQFLGGGIKSIQRGSITITPLNSSGTFAIPTAVNVNKTFLNVTGVNSGVFLSPNFPSGIAFNSVRVVLTNSTTVTATTTGPVNGGPSAINTVVSFEIVEFL